MSYTSANIPWRGHLLICGFCNRFWDGFWNKCDAWEREHSNDSKILAQESDHSYELIQQASALNDSDPSAALPLYVRAADAGSVWAMEALGWQYWTGAGVAADAEQAQDYYRRAVAGGSCMARINYARILAELQRHDESELVLKDGVASGFIPAYFWSARLRYDRRKEPQVANEIRPLLEHAARNGHPGAQLLLSQMMLTGRFGLFEIPRGLVSAASTAFRYAGAH